MNKSLYKRYAKRMLCERLKIIEEDLIDVQSGN